MQPVKTKRDFVRRYLLNEFGNRGASWSTLLKFSNEPMFGLFHLRNRIAGGATHYNLSYEQIVKLWKSTNDPGSWYCTAMAPTDKTLIQGEVYQSYKGLELFYSCEKLPMREALAKSSKQVEGILSVSLLRYYLCPNSYEWLQHLLDTYSGHVVEFSSYSVEWGTLPGFNTVVWEIRSY